MVGGGDDVAKCLIYYDALRSGMKDREKRSIKTIHDSGYRSEKGKPRTVLCGGGIELFRNRKELPKIMGNFAILFFIHILADFTHLHLI